MTQQRPETDEIKRLKLLNARYLVMAKDAQDELAEAVAEGLKWRWLAEDTEKERLKLEDDAYRWQTIAKRHRDERDEARTALRTLEGTVRYAIESLDRLVVNRNYYAEDIIASVLGDLETAIEKGAPKDAPEAGG